MVNSTILRASVMVVVNAGVGHVFQALNLSTHVSSDDKE